MQELTADPSHGGLLLTASNILPPLPHARLHRTAFADRHPAATAGEAADHSLLDRGSAPSRRRSCQLDCLDLHAPGARLNPP